MAAGKLTKTKLKKAAEDSGIKLPHGYDVEKRKRPKAKTATRKPAKKKTAKKKK